MDDPIAFPIPVDAATAAWAGPVFVLMALAGFAVLVWQAVRYFRDGRGEEHPHDDGNEEGEG